MKKPVLATVLTAVVACGGGGTTPTPSQDAGADQSTPDSGTTPDTGSPDTGADAVADAAVDVFFDCSKPVIDPEVVLSGTPDYTVKEAAVFSAPIGSSDTTLFNQSLSKVEGPDHVYDATFVFFKAAQAHAGPYDTELATGLAKSPFKSSGCFALADLDAPNGLIFAFNVVPKNNAQTGKSFESPTVGPVILSDVTIDGNLYVNGTLTDADFDGTIAKAPAVYNDQQYIGYAHLFVSAGENQAVSPKKLVAGDYRYEMKLTNQSGVIVNNVHFRVK